jgi:hypothetical protein
MARLRHSRDTHPQDVPPRASDSISASSSTQPPRETLTKMAVGFIKASVLKQMMLRVSSVSGHVKATTSA